MQYLAFYALVVFSLVLFRELGQKSSLDRFLVADRKVAGNFGSMSIAASWIWAPAIFISTQTGYKWGLSGLIWFVIPNMLALVIFAPLAERLRKSLPDGYSYIQYLRRGDKSFTKIQLYLQLIMQIVIFAIQIVAGGELLSTLSGAEYHWMVIGMALTPFCYTLFSGLRTSVFTDAIQYVVIAVSAIIILFAFFGSTSTSYTLDPRPFNPINKSLLLEFGISSALGLIVAIFADHQQWQRAFAIKNGEVSKTFYKAALLHGLVTVTLGILGSLIYSTGFKPKRIDLVGIEYVSTYYAPAFVPIFVVMAICALISTLDSALCAFSSLASKEFGSSTSLKKARSYMAALVLAGIILAQARPSLLTLWFIASTIRLSSFAPTIISLLGDQAPSKIFTVAIGSALTIGGCIFAFGVYLGDSTIRTTGMLLSFGISLIILTISKCYKFSINQFSEYFRRI